MDRIVQGISAKISVQITDGGTLVDPDSNAVLVAVTADDGTVVIGSTPATRDGVGIYSYTLSPTDTANLNWLTASWSGVLDGFTQTFETEVEIVGGFLFAIEQAKADVDLVSYDTALIAKARTLAEQSLEDALGVACVPRYQRETVNGTGTFNVRATKRKIRTVRSVSLDGTPFTVDELSDLRPYGSQIIHRGTIWDAGFSNFVIRYEHGLDHPPERVARAALLLAKNWLIEGPVDDRATSLTTGDGTFALVTPGLRGAMFDLPEVNAVVQMYGYADAI